MVHEDVNLSESAAGLRMAVVISRYHEAITSALLDGARAAFVEAGGLAGDLHIIDAPGTFELAVLCGALARDAHERGLDGIVALGCVISGETAHDQYINTATSTSLAQLAANTGIPIAFGVLTCANMQQAIARAGGDKGNKGTEAMQATIAAAGALRTLRLAGERL